MKKTLITLLALCGVASAGEVTFTDLTQNITDSTSGITFTQSTGLFTGSVTNYEGADAGKGSNGAITFAIDLAAASALTEDTCILTLNYDGNTAHDSGENTGIYYNATDDKISTWYNGQINVGGTVGNTKVADYKQTINGKDYTILTLRYDDIGATDATKGVSLFSTTSEIIEYWGLGSSSYDEVTSIYINTDLVKAVTIMTGEINDATAKAGVTNLAAAMVPEPTTATLSLLALAGLAARRRRK